MTVRISELLVEELCGAGELAERDEGSAGIATLAVEDVWAVDLRVTGITTKGSVVSWLGVGDSVTGIMVSTSETSGSLVGDERLPNRLAAVTCCPPVVTTEEPVRDSDEAVDEN